MKIARAPFNQKENKVPLSLFIFLRFSWKLQMIESKWIINSVLYLVVECITVMMSILKCLIIRFLTRFFQIKPWQFFILFNPSFQKMTFRKCFSLEFSSNNFSNHLTDNLEFLLRISLFIFFYLLNSFDVFIAYQSMKYDWRTAIKMITVFFTFTPIDCI